MSLQNEFQQAAGPLDITLEEGVTMLFDAVIKDDLDTIRALVAAGVPVDSRNESGDNALILAAGKNKIGAATALLDLGADANFINSEGFNASWYAARLRERDISDLLLDHGAKPETIPSQHLTPMLIHAVIQGNERLVGSLLSAGAFVAAVTDEASDERLLQRAARGGNAAIVRMLIAAGADVNATNKNKASVLRASMESGNFDTVKVVLDAGADTQNRSRDAVSGLNTTDCGFGSVQNDFEIARLVAETAKKFELIEKAREGKAAEVAALLEEGAATDAVDRFGKTALTYASTNNDADVVRVLLQHGASVHVRGSRGDLPINAAAFNKGAAVIPLLCEAGASVFDKDSSGAAAVDLLAMKGGDEGTCQIIACYRTQEIGNEAYSAAHKNIVVAPMRKLRFRTSLQA